VLDGVITNIELHQALMDSRPFLDGVFTTNLIDRVGSAAFLPPAG
jgi:biotin carboxylase